MYTKIKDRRCEINLSKLCASLKINYESLSFKNFNYTIKKFKKNISVCRNLKEPVVVEFNIKTLGHFIKNNKYINYHHGMANLSLIDKIFFNRSETLYKLKELIDKN